MLFEILSGLWISDKDDIDKSFLLNKNIKLIINCSKEINSRISRKIEEIRIPLEELSDNNDINYINRVFYDYIFDTLSFIHQHKMKRNILLYSTNNNQRPISIIIAYIIYYTNLEPIQAILFAKTKCENNILLPKPYYLYSFDKIYEKKNMNKI